MSLIFDIVCLLSSLLAFGLFVGIVGGVCLLLHRKVPEFRRWYDDLCGGE